MDERKLRLGVVGCGRWGPNHIRVFSEHNRSCVPACADPDPTKLQGLKKRFPGIRALTDYHDLLCDDTIDAIVVATPTNTHYEIACEALVAGKHVLVEKPVCATVEEGLELVKLADATGLVLMVGHTFLFNNGIMKLRDLIVSGELGRLHYLDATRTNLGPIRGDVNALYDLATHDISIFNYLLGSSPMEVSALGSCISQDTIEDVCFTTLRYPNGTLGHIHVSWMNPRKVRTLTAVGSRRMVHWDDVNPFEPVRIYDKGVKEPPHYNSFGEFKYLLRGGDVHLPSITQTEPLVNQAQAFLDWVLDGKPCVSDARYGVDVVKVLEAATHSIKNSGTLCSTGISVVASREAVLATAPPILEPDRAVRPVKEPGKEPVRDI